MRILFDSVVPAMEGRPGGYTRIYKLGHRTGDGAEMCLLQWVVTPKKPEASAEKAAPEAESEKKA